MTISPSTSAFKSIPADPAVWYTGSEPSPARSSRTRTGHSSPITLKREAGVGQVTDGRQREPVPAKHLRRERPHLLRGHRVDAVEDRLRGFQAGEEHLAHRKARHPVSRAFQRKKGVSRDELPAEGDFLVRNPFPLEGIHDAARDGEHL